MGVKIKNDGNYTLISVEHTRMDAVHAPSFRKTVGDQLGCAHKTIILDLSNVEFIDSSSLGAIISIYKMLPEEENLLLCGAGGNVQQLFHMTRMNSILPMYPDVDSAVQATMTR